MKAIRSLVHTYASLESGIAVVTAAALLFFVVVRGDVSRYILIAVVACGTLPLVYAIVRSVLAKKFGVDVIALIAIISALLIGEYTAAGMILLMLSGGEALERFAEGRARTSLTRLLAAAPTHAHRVVGEKTEECLLTALRVGDTVLIKQKEVVPVDGIVVYGESSIDQSMITGEPLPRTVREHDRVYSGSVNGDAVMHVRVEKTHEHSTYATIVRLVREAEEHKAPLVRMADTYSVLFTCIVFALAGTAYFYLGSSYLAVAVLVVATPCPLILAAPIAFIAGMSRAAQQGIIVKHGGVFEGVVASKQFVFDKTGTLTFGEPRVVAVHTYGSAYTEAQLLHYIGSAEQLSTHILARSIIQYVREHAGETVFPKDFVENFGNGVTATVDGVRVLIGKKTFLEGLNCTFSDDVAQDIASIKEKGDMAVCVACDGVCVAILACEDVPRPAVKTMLAAIRAAGKGTVLATGDTHIRASTLAKELGFSSVLADCLPEAKHAFIVEEQKKGRLCVMVGDGINDAPALRAAHVGIALGAHGDTVATDAADAVLVVDAIDRIGAVLHISERTVHIATQSIVVGIGLSVCAMCVALAGYLPPTVGALLQEGIDVIVILNALRALRA